MRRRQQLNFFGPSENAYGGVLFNTRRGRASGRALSTTHTMHLVLRSSKAKGNWSFRRSGHAASIQKILKKFAHRYGIKILSVGNAGNHLHLHIKISARLTYKPFIRAITGAIAMAVTGASRWSKSYPRDQWAKRPVGGVLNQDKQAFAWEKNKKIENAKLKFWDYRPFSRIVFSRKAYLSLRDYVLINNFEGHGISRPTARALVAKLNWRVVKLGFS